MYYTDKRHETGGKPKEETFPLQEWRMRDRLKTVSAALVLCLNIGVDPPGMSSRCAGTQILANFLKTSSRQILAQN